MKTIQMVSVLLLPCLVAGCISVTQYEGSLRPVSPKPHGVQFYRAVGVDSVHPTFAWKWAAGGSSQLVDLAIWEAVYKGKGFRSNTGSYDKGSLVYRKDGIGGTEHMVQTNLAPETIYFWSIKPSGTRDWATAKHSLALGNTYEQATGQFFSIRTPAQP